ncbi:MAG: DivIVA domain-containing protein [Acidimicrobiia bacterium]|nr:DivIVA domain-containing protein [Acidimicrobiia bacterium]
MNDFRDFEGTEFEIVRRGYDRGAVDSYLSELRAELARLQQEPGDVPGDGSYPEPVQAELDRVATEVEAIIGSARQAAEGLRTRAAAEASRWREEASSDARRWRSEAEEASTRLRSDAEAATERLLAEAQEESTKRRTEADAYVARVREEADAYAHQTRQVAESEAAQLTDEADAYSQQARTAADAYASQTREAADTESAGARAEAREDAAGWRNEAETEATRLRAEADVYAREVRTAASSEAEQLSAEAQAAADATQTAAENYASTLRSSSEAEASRQVSEAQAAAEIARASVWDESTAILEAVAREIQEVRERGESEALAVIAEAEQQSHRLVSQARQSTEEQRRAARIEAERLVGDAQAQHDEIIELANRAAASAQERAQALERRREELMGQLEKAQQAMRTMEEELETRRETLRDRDVVADSSTVKIVPQAEPEERAGVRIIPPAGAQVVAPALPKTPVSAEEIMDEVRALREERESARVEPAPSGAVEVEPVAVASEAGEPAPPGGDIDALFANLRGGAQPTEKRAPAVDPDDLRERMLLPLQNRAHRLIKKELTEQQNLTLEQLRVAGEDWMPDAAEHSEAFAPAIAELVLESARSGYLAAMELGIRADSPPDIVTDNADTQVAGFASDLTDAVAHVLDASRSAGETSRKTSAAASRVYREWRTDGAELRLREISDVAYADALRTALRLEGIEDTDWALGDWAAARHAS